MRRRDVGVLDQRDGLIHPRVAGPGENEVEIDDAAVGRREEGERERESGKRK